MPFKVTCTDCASHTVLLSLPHTEPRMTFELLAERNKFILISFLIFCYQCFGAALSFGTQSFIFISISLSYSKTLCYSLCLPSFHTVPTSPFLRSFSPGPFTQCRPLRRLSSRFFSRTRQHHLAPARN
jgi:hypothetical protein